MGMKLKSGADLCGFQLTNFCVQGEASAPSDAALGRKYFHTNATDDVATGISLLHRERIYLGEGAWRATAYLDDIAAINEKLNLITGDTDTDTLINNLKDLEEFLKDFSETDKLKSLLDGKLSTSGGTISTGDNFKLTLNATNTDNYNLIRFTQNGVSNGYIGTRGNAFHIYFPDYTDVYYNNNTLIHSGNISNYTAGSAYGIKTNEISNVNDAVLNSFFRAGFQASNRPDGNSNYASGLTFYNDTLGYTYQLAFSTTNALYSRRKGANGWESWKTIAFTDSDITGYSAGLKHSNGTIGATVDANGLVTIENTTRHADYAPLNVINNLNTAYSKGIIITAPNIPQNQAGAEIIFGKQFSKNNLAAMSFFHAADDINKNAICFGFHSTPNLMRIIANGNVLIGTTTDSGEKLQVAGKASFTDKLYAPYIFMGKDDNGIYIHKAGISWHDSKNAYVTEIAYFASDAVEFRKPITISGDLYVKGNIIATKEVSAGGAGAEEGTSGSGSAEGVSEIFTPTSTSMAFDHNLGEDVIVQVYEKNNSVWNLVMVDVEITSATRVTLRFGKTETTQHKVVIMGV